MRHGRAKQSRRTLQFYRLNASHFKPPYKVLLDGTFLVSSIRNKVPLYDRFTKILQNEAFTCHVTRSTLAELEKLSKQSFKGSEEEEINFFAKARQYGLDECEIIENKVPTTSSHADDESFKEFSDASRDIYNLATEGGNNHQAYFVATQDDTLSDALRTMPYVPIFRLGRAVLLMESPSSASRSYTGNIEHKKLASAGGLMTAEERQMVNAVNRKDKKKRREVKEEEQKKLNKRERDEVGGGVNVRRKKRAKGPNPLSCNPRQRFKL